MKRPILFLFFILLGLAGLQSQTLTGKIVDSKTRQPISQVSVYLNGTSIHTFTNDNGEFRLSINKAINTDLIISRVGYHLISVPNPFRAKLDEIYLTEKDNTLDEITVISEGGLTREQKLKMFRDEFLGKTKAGKSCKILNEDDILLMYNSNDKIFSASAENPIIIKNEYLGYEISYALIDFRVRYIKGIKSLEPVESFIIGKTSFVDLAPDNKNLKGRRRNAYKSSAAFFFKNFANQTLRESSYEMYNLKGVQIMPEMYFTVKDTLSMKKISVIGHTTITQIPAIMDDRTIKALVDIYFEGGKRSRLMFLTDSFLVDEFGCTDPINRFPFSGYIASRRIGDIVPLDYEP